MNAPRYAVTAARLLSKYLPSARSAAPDRQRSLATIRRAIQARSRRLRLRLGAGVAAALTAAAVTMLFVSWKARDATQISISVAAAGNGPVTSSGSAEPLSGGLELLPGQRLETPVDGGATLRLSTGTAMVLAGSTSFRVDSQGRDERFSLERGELSAHVAKLKDGQRFIVETPDAEVEVRGTRFRLRVVTGSEHCGSGSRTRLEVTEGVVEVRFGAKGERVVAGERWPKDCAPPGDAEGVSAAPASSSTPPARGGTAAPGLAAPSSAARVVAPEGARPLGRDSALSLQNDLFARGVAARRRGDVNGALRAYSELLLQFPNGALAENATAERLRLLAAQGDPRAKGEAERYLARYPRGFAAGEARRVAGGP
ncbi:MAG: hypothetical protein EOO73_26755 [Myxococcales bacterium]|nr:MAG: hypothetical protein EOO73_26755 [Myxococcales bacterium]